MFVFNHLEMSNLVWTRIEVISFLTVTKFLLCPTPIPLRAIHYFANKGIFNFEVEKDFWIKLIERGREQEFEHFPGGATNQFC